MTTRDSGPSSLEQHMYMYYCGLRSVLHLARRVRVSLYRSGATQSTYCIHGASSEGRRRTRGQSDCVHTLRSYDRGRL